jgi:hypothetical protein
MMLMERSRGVRRKNYIYRHRQHPARGFAAKVGEADE